MVEEAPQQGLCPVCGHWLPMRADQMELGLHGRCRYTGRPSVRARLSGSAPAASLGLADQPATLPPHMVAARESEQKHKLGATRETAPQDFLHRLNSPVTLDEAARYYENRSLAWLQQEQRLFILSGALQTGGPRERKWLRALDDALLRARTEPPRKASRPTRPPTVERRPIEEGAGVQRARAELHALKERRDELGRRLAGPGYTGGKSARRRVRSELTELTAKISQAHERLELLLYGPPKGRSDPGPSVVRHVVSGGLPTLGRGR